MKKCNVVDCISDAVERLELCEALLRNRLSISSSGVYSASHSLSDTLEVLVTEQLDSCINNLNLLSEELETKGLTE